jgi:cytochrome bd-type quinol oxidase subunit 1
MPGVVVPMTLFTILYIVLAAIVVVLIQSLVAETQ